MLATSAGSDSTVSKSGPASSSSTERASSSLSRAAKTAPADPAPTTITSYSIAVSSQDCRWGAAALIILAFADRAPPAPLPGRWPGSRGRPAINTQIMPVTAPRPSTVNGIS